MPPPISVDWSSSGLLVRNVYKCPLIDSVYLMKFGRRKTWLFPTQLLIGVLMLSCANYVNDFLENRETTSSRLQHIEDFLVVQVQHQHCCIQGIYAITAIFACFTVLCSILDIIQDGWLLNLLSKRVHDSIKHLNSKPKVTQTLFQGRI